MKINIKEIVIFAMLGSLMFASKVLMEILPNMHLVGVLIVAITVVYRQKALYPIYVFVFLQGLFGGFNLWWYPYLYIWAILWLMVMLIPKNLPQKVEPFVYMAVCSLHGFLYGIFYSVFQAIVYNLGLKGMVAWIITGIPFDITHGISNLLLGVLIVPLIKAMRMANKSIGLYQR